jgi:hypothetical protein
MADTATTRNRFRKLESGQYANAWATPKNEDYGSDRLDEALDGVSAFTLSGSKTLTSTNYETDEARMRFIHITGGTGGTITIPSVEKWYWVRNASSGNVIFTAGGTTVTIPTATVAAVLCNGTNCFLTTTASDASAAAASASAAATSATNSANSATNSATSATNSANSATSAATSATNAANSATAAQTAQTAAEAAAIPNQSGHSGKIVTTNGTAASWSKITDITADRPFIGATPAAGASGYASFRLPHGAAPTTNLTNGDLWTTTSGLFARVNGATVGPLIDASSAPSSAWTQIGSTQTPSAVSSSSITSIPATYQDLLIEILGLSHDSGTGQGLRIEMSGDNGTTWTTANLISVSTAHPASATMYGGGVLSGYLKGAGLFPTIIDALASDYATTASSNIRSTIWRIAAGINAIRLSWSAGNFDAGSWKLWGK